MSRFCVIVLGLLMATAAVAAEPAPEAKTGLQVGENAPQFKLRDQHGEERSLAEFLTKEVAGKRFGRVNLDGVPYPGTLLVDQAGQIRAKLFVDGYRDRHSVDELLEAARKLKAE